MKKVENNSDTYDVPSFGTLLHRYRLATCDPDGKRSPYLSLQKFADLLSKKAGWDVSYQSVNQWEKDKHKISPDDRLLLTSMIAVLYQYQGIASLEKANALLQAGNYRELNALEIETIDPKWTLLLPASIPTANLEANHPVDSPPTLPRGYLWQALFRFQDWLSFSPIPSEDSFPVGFSDKLIHLGSSWLHPHHLNKLWLLILYILFAFLVVWGCLPLWQLPRGTNQLVLIYSWIGIVIVPAFIALLTYYHDTPHWSHSPANRNRLLFTYEGALVGFSASYLFIFILSLILQELQLNNLPKLGQLCAGIFIIYCTRAFAQYLPRQIWHISHQLPFNTADTSLILLILLFTFTYSWLIYQFYPFLAPTSLGTPFVLALILMITALFQWHKNKTDSYLPSAHIWAIGFLLLWVLLAWAYQPNSPVIILLVTASANIVFYLRRQQIHATLSGSILFFLGSIGLWQLTIWNQTIAGIVAIILLLFWLIVGRPYFWLPSTFWIPIIATLFAHLLDEQNLLPETTAYSLVALICLGTLLWEIRLHPHQ